MTNNQPLVSVCIPAYNAEEYIRETVECVINQTYQNLQIIVVDDCSTDDTLRILQSIADERLEVYSLKKNRHVGHANNVCLSKVKGVYTAHLDADDLWFPDKIERQINFLENHPEYGACFTFVDVIDDIGNKRTEYEDFINALQEENRAQAAWIRHFCDKLNCLIHSTCVMRSEILQTVGIHNCAYLYLHDFDYWTRIILRYNIYIMPDTLGSYRIFDDGRNNSNLNDKGAISHDSEYVEIIYHLIDDAPDAMFLEAFQDKLRYEGPHEKIDIEFEKAFILLDAFLRREKNKLLGIRKLTELFGNHENIQIAEDHFHFTIRDFYKLKEQQIYYDYEELLHFTLKSQEKDLEISRKEDTIEQKEQQLGELNHVLALRDQQIAQQTRELSSIYSSRSWKIARGIQFLFRFFRPNKETRILVYGYPCKNLGDDLFFLTLIKRYPQTIFMFYDVPGGFVEQYRAFFASVQNVIVYSHDEYKIAALNKFGRNILHKQDFARYLLARRSAGAIHIGGSIFQQFDHWREDYALRKKRQLLGKPFFAIGCNFGSYVDTEFYKLWHKSIKTYADICFRDTYSYDLFQDLPNARYAPDILFSYRPEKTCELKKQIAISMIQLDTSVRGELKAYKEPYIQTLADFSTLAVKQGYEIQLVAFCEYEQDTVTMQEIYDGISEEAREHCHMLTYTQNNLEDVIQTLGESEVIFASRFHAMVLGWTLGRKVVPIVYNSKTQHVLQDVSFDGPCVTIEDFGWLSSSQLLEYAMNSKALDVTSLAETAEKHFEKLDAYLK